METIKLYLFTLFFFKQLNMSEGFCGSCEMEQIECECFSCSYILTLLVNGNTQLLCHLALVQELRKTTSQSSFKVSPSACACDNWTQVLDLSNSNVRNNFCPNRSLSKSHEHGTDFQDKQTDGKVQNQASIYPMSSYSYSCRKETYVSAFFSVCPSGCIRFL